MLLDVVLEVAGDGAGIGGHGGARLLVVEDLVAREEGQGVGVVLEGLDDGEGAVEVGGIVRLPGVPAGQGLADEGRVDVEHHVHAGGVEDAGALVVVQVGVDIVHADGVDTQNLEQGGITQADIGVAEGVAAGLLVVAGRAAGLVGDADNLQAVAGLGVDEVLALDLKGRDGDGERCAERQERGLKLHTGWKSVPGSALTSAPVAATYKHG